MGTGVQNVKLLAETHFHNLKPKRSKYNV